jgi:tryptophan-rich sensory protein
MHVIIAAAGLAEAAELFGLLIVGGILLVAAGCVALSWWKHSLVAVIIAFVLGAATGALTQPWTVIAPPPSEDPDAAYWLVRERFVSVVWAVLVIAAVVCLVRVIRHRRLKKIAAQKTA